MLRLKGLGKDHYGSALLIALGAGVLALGLGYRVGTLNQMGAGYIPVVLGILLMLVGLAIGLTAGPAGRAGPAAPGHLPGHGSHSGPEWRGWLCILAAVFAFVLVGEYGGLMPATFVSVFVAAMGDRNNTAKGAALLGAGMVVFCLIVFHYGLKVQLPLFQWG